MTSVADSGKKVDMGNKRAPCPAPGRQRTRRKKCRIWKNLLRLLADVSQDAAVNVQDEAVDEVGSGRSQEDSGSTQILSLAPAACGGLGNDEAVEGLSLIHICILSPIALLVLGAWSDGTPNEERMAGLCLLYTSRCV